MAVECFLDLEGIKGESEMVSDPTGDFGKVIDEESLELLRVLTGLEERHAAVSVPGHDYIVVSDKTGLDTDALKGDTFGVENPDSWLHESSLVGDADELLI
jgi:hypothetical protein